MKMSLALYLLIFFFSLASCTTLPATSTSKSADQPDNPAPAEAITTEEGVEAGELAADEEATTAVDEPDAVGPATEAAEAEVTVVEEEAAEAEQAGVWETRAALLDANSEMAVAELDGKIYVMGGYPASRQTVNTVQIYDPASDSWSYGPPLPRPSNHNVAIAVGGKLYAIGGQFSASGDGSYLNDVFEFDPATQSWTVRALMPTF